MDDPFVIVGLVLGLIAAIAAIIVIRPQLSSSKPASVARALDHFQQEYADLRARQVSIGDSLLAHADSQIRHSEIPMFAPPSWIFDRPRELSSIDIRFLSTRSTVDSSRTKVMKGLSLAGPITYREAIFKLNSNSKYFDGTIYRPVEVKADSGSLAIDFEEGKYFDYIDTSEVLGYEGSLKPSKNFGLRQSLTPFDLRNRVASLGVLTLTVCKSTQGPRFYMHKRSGKFVVGNALYHVVPAGEFAPSDISIAAVQRDFDLWRNIMREYAEEFLGHEDAQGQDGRRLDYDHSSPYRELNEAVRTDKLSIRAFGIALDPLTFKPELLTVAVFDSGVFHTIFQPPFPGTDEGKIVEDIPFTQDSIDGYLKHPSTRHGAKACLQLAWKFRDQLGL